MPILSDFYKPPVPPIEPAAPKADPCLLEFLRRLSLRISGNDQSVDPKLLITNWPSGLHCSLDECADLAIKDGYAVKTSTGVSITQEGRDYVASHSAT